MHCLESDIYTPWVELDHIVALTNGGTDTVDNLQGLCDRHHKQKTAADMGFLPRYGANPRGIPRDPTHHWNR